MLASRGMGAMNPSKIPKGRKPKMADGGGVGLYANINAKRKRIAEGSGEKMRSPGKPGAPTNEAFVNSAKTAKK
jgi:hypothetical protein